VLGNGWSATFYDVEKIAGYGALIGCNLSFTKYPVDYLVWQDSGIVAKCLKFPGIKITSLKFAKSHKKIVDWDTTFFLQYGRRRRDGINLFKSHSGGLALQIAAFLGCNPIILVGCDCCLFQDGKEYRGNVFKDKQGARAKANPSSRKRAGKGVYTIAHLQGFAGTFNKLYKALKEKHDIYKMGSFGIVDIPHVEFEELWTDKHPGTTKRKREKDAV
jgi:hypothetical protein